MSSDNIILLIEIKHVRYELISYLLITDIRGKNYFIFNCYKYFVGRLLNLYALTINIIIINTSIFFLKHN